MSEESYGKKRAVVDRKAGEKGYSLSEDSDRFLLFSIAEELFGTPLLGVREVVEPQNPKPIPNTVKFFTGVINIRGQIVGVIDLRLRFGQTPDDNRGRAMIVFDTDTGPIAALVDAVESVISIRPSHINFSPNLKTEVSADYLIGIGHHNERLITLIDLNKTLSTEELAFLRASKLTA
jgi:purine-binding chemotaxis protein CheW